MSDTQYIKTTNPKTDDLLACPFCGSGDVKYFKNPDMWEGMLHEIRCSGCATVVRDSSLDRVIKKWNTRFEANS